MVGPDHFASVEPSELKQIVKVIRRVSEAFGTDKKILTPEEEKNIHYMRRSLHLKKDKKEGDLLNKEDIKITRPFDGIDPWSIYEVIGKILKRSKDENDPLKWEDVSWRL